MLSGSVRLHARAEVSSSDCRRCAGLAANARTGCRGDQAIEIIREQLQLENWLVEQRETVAAHVATGFAQAERGELTDGDAAFEVLRQRRAERLKPQG